MTTTATTTSGVRRTIRRITQTWSELDYAQRRLTEIRTGLQLTKPQERRHAANTVDQLEELFALEQPPRAA